MSLEIEGLDELLAKIEKLNVTDRELDVALERGAEVIKQEIESKAPVSNISHEHVKDDIHISQPKGAGSKRNISIGVGKETAWRAKFVEFGTVKQPAKPFIQPAVENKKREALSIIIKELKEVLGF